MAWKRTRIRGILKSLWHGAHGHINRVDVHRRWAVQGAIAECTVAHCVVILMDLDGTTWYKTAAIG